MWSLSRPRRINDSAPRKAAPVSAAISVTVKGPRLRPLTSALVVSSVRTEFQPRIMVLTSLPTSSDDQPTAIISLSTRTYPDLRSASR